MSESLKPEIFKQGTLKGIGFTEVGIDIYLLNWF